MIGYHVYGQRKLKEEKHLTYKVRRGREYFKDRDEVGVIYIPRNNRIYVENMKTWTKLLR